MSRLLVVATAGAGGDLQPLVSAPLAMAARGHEISFVADQSVQQTVGNARHESRSRTRRAAIGTAPSWRRAAGDGCGRGRSRRSGLIVQAQIADWARETAQPVAEAVGRQRPDAVITSLFGVEVLDLAWPVCHSRRPRCWRLPRSTSLARSGLGIDPLASLMWISENGEHG